MSKKHRNSPSLRFKIRRAGNNSNSGRGGVSSCICMSNFLRDGQFGGDEKWGFKRVFHERRWESMG